MSLDADISDALAEIASEAGRAVTLRRGEAAVTVTAVPATTRTEVDESNGARLEVVYRDYIVAVADYDFGDGPLAPANGDEIDDLDETFEVTGLGDSVPCWQWSDRGHTYYRIHTIER